MSYLNNSIQEKELQLKLSALANSENAIKSILKDVNGFQQAAFAFHTSQKQLQDDLVQLQDSYFEKEVSGEVNKFFDKLSEILLQISNSYTIIPQKVNEFVWICQDINKNSMKKKAFLQEKYQHYLGKIQHLARKEQEVAVKNNPNIFFSSIGKEFEQQQQSKKMSRNKQKLKTAENKYVEQLSRMLDKVNEAINKRNGIVKAMYETLSESLLKNVSIFMDEMVRVISKKDVNLQYQCEKESQFSSNNSLEAEQFEREMAIRQLFNISPGIDFPVIRRRSIKISKDGQLKEENTQENPFPFQCDDPQLISDIKNLANKEKNIFDFGDFNLQDKQAPELIANCRGSLKDHERNSYNQCKRNDKNSSIEDEPSLVQVHSVVDEEEEEDQEVKQNQIKSTVNKNISVENEEAIKYSQILFQREQQIKKHILAMILEREESSDSREQSKEQNQSLAQLPNIIQDENSLTPSIIFENFGKENCKVVEQCDYSNKMKQFANERAFQQSFQANIIVRQPKESMLGDFLNFQQPKLKGSDPNCFSSSVSTPKDFQEGEPIQHIKELNYLFSADNQTIPQKILSSPNITKNKYLSQDMKDSNDSPSSFHLIQDPDPLF